MLGIIKEINGEKKILPLKAIIPFLDTVVMQFLNTPKTTD